MEITIKGNPETLIVNQPRIVDTKRIDGFLEEISNQQLSEVRRLVANLILNPPQTKWQDSE